MGICAGLLSQIFGGLRLRLFVLVLLACTPLLALVLHTASADRRRAKADWELRSRRIIDMPAREEFKVIGATRQLLLTVAQSAPVRSGDPHACQALLDNLFGLYPRYANLAIIRTNGELIAGALPIPNPAGETNRHYFRRALQTRAFAVGTFPTSPAGGRPMVSFGHPVFDQSGQPTAVIFAALDLDSVSPFGSDLAAQLPKGASWMEIDKHGTILARYPEEPELGRGRSFTNRLVVVQAFSGQEGLVEAEDAEGVPTFYAVAALHGQLAGAQTAAILSIPKQALFAEADATLARNLAWLGVAAALALVLGWVVSDIMVLGPVKALARSSARLAAGDLSARTGLPHAGGELGQLTRAFDQMAEALELRELEQQRASKKLQVMSRRLVEAQETERRRIARELHDEIGQALTAAEMNLQSALQSSDPTTSIPRLQASAELIERVLEQAHDLSLNLRPSMLDDLGLESAVRWYTNRQAELSGLEAEFHADPLPNRLDPVIETECFRIAQEALTNIVRHAQASTVRVRLTQTEGHLDLSVRDDGLGFDVALQREQAVRGASLGLLSMEERASLAGGGLEYKSAPGEGTEVHAWFPLKWRTEENQT